MIPDAWLWVATFVALGFILSMALQGVAILLAPRLGLMDAPGERKVHASPIPRAGGICIWISMGFVWFLVLAMGAKTIPLTETTLVPLGCFLMLVFIGFLDDKFSIPWQPRLMVHFIAAGMTLWSLGIFENLVAGILALFFMVALINAFNMIDNMDWQCGGVSFLVLVSALVVFMFQKNVVYGDIPALVAVTLLGPLVAFLWWNRPVAKIFLGDAGSLPLGFLLCWLILTILKPVYIGDPWLLVVLPAVFLIPLYDLVTVVSIRISKGKSPFHPDKQHLSHRMVYGGATPSGAVLRILMIQAAGVIAGVMVMVIRHPLVPKVVLAWLILWILALAIMDYKTFHSRVTE